MGYIWQYLGLQDSSFKSSIAEKDEGPLRWNKVHIIDRLVYQLIGEGKCTKNQIIIEKCLQRVTLEEPLDYKELQSYWGLLNYFFDTYNSCMPFLKVMHITLDS